MAVSYNNEVIANKVSVSNTGTSTDSVGYITIDGEEKKIGDKLYQHNIQANYNNNPEYIGFTATIYTLSATPITNTTLKDYIKYGSKGFLQVSGLYRYNDVDYSISRIVKENATSPKISVQKVEFFPNEIIWSSVSGYRNLEAFTVSDEVLEIN